MILFTFSHPLPHPFIWESKSGETARSLTQLVSVTRGHFHSVCVFYQLLVHCSQWEDGPAAQDLSSGKKPAIYLIPYHARPLPWWPRPSTSLLSSLAQFCITACPVRPRYTQTSLPPRGCTHVACVSTLARHTHPHPPQAIYLPLTTHSCPLETFVEL